MHSSSVMKKTRDGFDFLWSPRRIFLRWLSRLLFNGVSARSRDATDDCIRVVRSLCGKLILLISNNPRLWQCYFRRVVAPRVCMCACARGAHVVFSRCWSSLSFSRCEFWLVTSGPRFLAVGSIQSFDCRRETSNLPWWSYRLARRFIVGLVLYDRFFAGFCFAFVLHENLTYFLLRFVMCVLLNWRRIFERLLPPHLWLIIFVLFSFSVLQLIVAHLLRDVSAYCMARNVIDQLALVAAATAVYLPLRV